MMASGFWSSSSLPPMRLCEPRLIFAGAQTGAVMWVSSIGTYCFAVRSSAPHAAHASRDIDPHASARASRCRFRLSLRPGLPFEESEQFVRNEAGA